MESELNKTLKAILRIAEGKNRSSSASTFANTHPAETTGLEITHVRISGNAEKDKQKHVEGKQTCCEHENRNEHEGRGCSCSASHSEDSGGINGPTRRPTVTFLTDSGGFLENKCGHFRWDSAEVDEAQTHTSTQTAAVRSSQSQL